MTNSELIDKLNKGDISSFQQLYSKFYVPLCVYAKRFTGDKDIAQEIVQDVFLSFWENREKIKISSSLDAFLFTSIRNQCLNHLKHLQVVSKYNKYYVQLLKDAQEYYLLTQETGDSILIANELNQAVKEAVNDLPEQCRKIFLMSRFDGLAHKEIATSLSITLNTVQKQVSIALEKLRKALKVYIK